MGRSPARAWEPPTWTGMQCMLPAELQEEIVLRYGDILRTGRLSFNGESMRWDVSGDQRATLVNFSNVLVPRLADALKGLGEDMLGRLVYWVCKAVSINYVIHRVVLYLHQRMGVL